MKADTDTCSHIARAFCELQMLQKKAMQGVGKEFGLSTQQMALMWHLSPNSPPAMSQVAELMDCDMASVTGIVDKLEARRLLQRIRGEDKRVKMLELTPEGDQLRLAVRARLYQAPEWISSLTTEEKEQFAFLLQKCVSASKPAGI